MEWNLEDAPFYIEEYGFQNNRIYLTYYVTNASIEWVGTRKSLNYRLDQIASNENHSIITHTQS